MALTLGAPVRGIMHCLHQRLPVLPSVPLPPEPTPRAVVLSASGARPVLPPVLPPVPAVRAPPPVLPPVQPPVLSSSTPLLLPRWLSAREPALRAQARVRAWLRRRRAVGLHGSTPSPARPQHASCVLPGVFSRVPTVPLQTSPCSRGEIRRRFGGRIRNIRPGRTGAGKKDEIGRWVFF